MRSQCINESILIQKNLVRGEETLFKLNPLAVALRLQLRVAYVKLAAAIFAENPALIAAIKLEIDQIKASQLQLDQSQKLIIKTTELNTSLKMIGLQTQLSDISNQISSIWDYYLKTMTTVKITKMPKLSIVPDSPDIAPVYELSADHAVRQRLAYQWQHRFQTKTDAQALLNSENEFEMTCGSTAENKGGKWVILINAGKY